jgi:hypothetical protein
MAPPREAALAPAPAAQLREAALTLSVDLDEEAAPVVETAAPRLALESASPREDVPRLSRDDLARLESVLADIVDCQRLLDRARAG